MVTDFYPRPPCGGRRRAGHADTLVEAIFLSTPSVRRATDRPNGRRASGLFLSTPSVRRATFQPGPLHPRPERDFYPRPPCGGRP